MMFAVGRTLDGSFEEGLVQLPLFLGHANESNDTIDSAGNDASTDTDTDTGSWNDEELVLAPLHHMLVRYSELNENSTRYDRLVAAPSDGAMQIMWMGWTVITAICSLIILVIFSGLLSSKARNKPFNAYLLFLMLPDIILSALCCVTCLQNYILKHFSSLPMCHFQAFYCIFAVASNAWLSAVVCKQLHTMLISAHHFRRYKPPTTKQVFSHAAMAYLLSAFVASWTLGELILGTQNSQWWPHKTLLVGGVECLPMDFGLASTLFFCLIFFPLLMGIPLLYTLYLLYDIIRNNRLPPKGNRRHLTVYFFRLMLVFVVMWTPGLIFLFVSGQWLSPWVKWVGGSWCHLQGAVSAIASLWKPDIYAAVKDFCTCKVWRNCRCCRRFLPLPAPELDLEKLQQYRTTGNKRSNRTSIDSSGGGSGRRWRRPSWNSSLSWGNLSLLGGFGRSTTTFSHPCTNTCTDDQRSFNNFGSSLNLPFGNDDDDDSSSSRSSRSGDSASAHLEDEYNVSSNTRTIGRNLQSLVGNEDEEGEEEKEEELSFSDDAFEEFAARELAPEEVEESITCIMIDLDDDSDGDDDDEEDVGTCTDDASAACDIEMSVFQPDAVEDLDKEEEEEDDDESASFMIDAGSRSSHGLPNFSWHENAERRMASLERGNRRHSMTS